ncbi:MAG: DUF3649 domain-containing protein [Steroidobacteraceae bacterium]
MNVPASTKWSVVSRVVAAVGGGYLLASLMSIVVSRVVPLPHASAVMTGMLLSFLFYACAALWVFAARNARVAWAGLIALAVPLALIAWLLGPTPLATLP